MLPTYKTKRFRASATKSPAMQRAIFAVEIPRNATTDSTVRAAPCLSVHAAATRAFAVYLNSRVEGWSHLPSLLCRSVAFILHFGVTLFN